MKVLITHSYFLRFDAKQWELGQPYPPLGTLYAAAALERAGYETVFFDTMFCEHPDELSPVLEKQKPDVLVIYDDGFNYLTKMCLTNMREASHRMTAYARSMGIQVIVSSSDASDHADIYLDEGAGFIIKGEGEITLLELIKQLAEGNKDHSNIHGLIYRIQGKTFNTTKREALKNPDQLPRAAWHMLDIQPYRESWQKSSGYFSLNLSTTRGCPFHCNWCAKPIYGNRYNVHSPERIATEIEFLINTFKVHHFWMTDDIFGLKPGWVKTFTSLIKERGLEFRYKIQSRVDLLLTEDTIALLAESGCETIWVGAESGSQKILDAMEKGTTVSQIHEATLLMKKHGIRPAFFLQFGYPGETATDIKSTISMVRELQPDDIGISVSYPLPGTPFYEKVKSDLSKKANWSDSDELAMMYRSNYPPEFYKLLQRYVHRYYRSRQGMQDLIDLIKSPGKISGRILRRIGAIPFHLSSSWNYKRKMNAVLSTEKF